MRWLSRHLRPENHAKRKNNYQYTEVDIIVVDSRTVAESSDPGDAAAGPGATREQYSWDDKGAASYFSFIEPMMALRLRELPIGN